jgi:hypothetical protein
MIATIDVGIKHLAICIMKCDFPSDFTSYKIELWDVFNLLGESEKFCKNLTKTGNICNKKCGFKYTQDSNEVFCCKTHFPKDIKLTNKNTYKQKKVNDYLLQDIAEIVIKKLNIILNDNHCMFSNLTKVLIELQPKVNNKMKFISHLLYGKFIEYFLTNNINTDVRFVRAANKLKAYTGPPVECKLKGAYEQRKFYAVQYTKWFLNEKFNNNECDKWLPLLNNSPDKSDTFLMAINELHGIPKTYTKSQTSKSKSLRLKKRKV